MAIFCRVIFVSLLLLSLPGCDLGEPTSEKPWMGFAKHKESGKLQWWFSSYDSYDACIEALNWGVTNTVQKTWYEKPIGCGFSSNSYIKTIFTNLFVAEMEHFECLLESKNPELREMKMKYGAVLRGYENDCVNNSKHKVIF